MKIGDYPTKVESIASLSNEDSSLWIKRDDATNDRYGGNKVRKLEYLLEDGANRGAKRLLTFGAIGSHHVLATAIHGKAFGFEVAALLTPQPFSEHALANIQDGLAVGLDPIACSRSGLLPWMLARTWRPGDYLIPPGGSNVLGSMGYAQAAGELASQVSEGMACPDVIVVALGSGGTVAGLLAGLEETNLSCCLHAVQVYPKPLVSKTSTIALARAVAHRRKCNTSIHRLWQRCHVVGDRLGRGYGYATPWGQEAKRRVSEAGLTFELESTYTAKAFSHALCLIDARRYRRVLYWHTLSGAARTSVKSDELSGELKRLWKE